MKIYRDLFANRRTRRLLLLGLLFRIVLNSQSQLLALHVLHTLHHSYGGAGLLSAVVYLCTAGAELRRGPRLDKLGLRRTIVPSIIVNGICWIIAPFTPFLLLLLLGALAGWFEIPVLNVVKQALVIVTTERERRPALVADAVMADVSLLVGPPLGVVAINIWNTTSVLFVVRLLAVGCGLVAWFQNPPLLTDSSEVPRHVPRQLWLRPEFTMACIAYAVAVVVLSAEEMSVIAAMHNFHAKTGIGLELSIGAVGGMVGGYGYGAISKTVSPYVLLVGLGTAVVPCAFASGPVALAVAVFIVGVSAGSVFVACTDRMNSVVFEGARGKAIGFHFSLMWVGMAMGSLLASQAVDVRGSSGGFLFSAVTGISAGIGLGGIVRLSE